MHRYTPNDGSDRRERLHRYTQRTTIAIASLHTERRSRSTRAIASLHTTNDDSDCIATHNETQRTTIAIASLPSAKPTSRSFFLSHCVDAPSDNELHDMRAPPLMTTRKGPDLGMATKRDLVQNRRLPKTKFCTPSLDDSSICHDIGDEFVPAALPAMAEGLVVPPVALDGDSPLPLAMHNVALPDPHRSPRLRFCDCGLRALRCR